MTIGERITAARINRGWTQQMLADECGIGRPAINKIENGARKVSAIELVKIAKMLKCKPSALLEETDDVASAINAPDDYDGTQPQPSRCPNCGSRLFKDYGCVYNVALDLGEQTGWHCLHCCTTWETKRVGKQIRVKVTGVKPVTLQPGELRLLRSESAKRSR